MPETPQARSKTALLMVIIAAVILAPLGYSFVSSLFARESQTHRVFLEKPDPREPNCVKETKYMRYHHWELLREIREEVVRYGYRRNIGLYKCKECHKSRERFCNRCHDAVSASPDCYGCHYYP